MKRILPILILLPSCYIDTNDDEKKDKKESLVTVAPFLFDRYCSAYVNKHIRRPYAETKQEGDDIFVTQELNLYPNTRYLISEYRWYSLFKKLSVNAPDSTGVYDSIEVGKDDIASIECHSMYQQTCPVDIMLNDVTLYSDQSLHTKTCQFRTGDIIDGSYSIESETGVATTTSVSLKTSNCSGYANTYPQIIEVVPKKCD